MSTASNPGGLSVSELTGLDMFAVMRMNRLGRTAAFGVQVLDILRERNVKLWAGTTLHDLTNTSQYTLAVLELTMTGDADGIMKKVDLVGGRIGAVALDGKSTSDRHTNHYGLELGYRARFEADGDGHLMPVKGSVVVHPADAVKISTVWTMFASGSSIPAIKKALIALEYRTRDRKRSLLSTVSTAAADDVVRRLLTPDNARLHRTGEFVKRIHTNAPVNFLGNRPVSILPNGLLYVDVDGRYELHMINELPWGIPNDIWDKVDARFTERAALTASDHGQRR